MSKYHDAWKKLDALEEKKREQDRLYRELRRSILHEAVKNGELREREFFTHRPDGVQRAPVPQIPPGQCPGCGRSFRHGEMIIEYLDGNSVVAAYHPYCANARS